MYEELTNPLKGLNDFIQKKQADYDFKKRSVAVTQKFYEEWHSFGDAAVEGFESDIFFVRFVVYYLNNGARGIDAIGYVGSLKENPNEKVFQELLQMNTLPLPISIGTEDNFVTLRLAIDSSLEFESEYYEKMLEFFWDQYSFFKGYIQRKGWLTNIKNLPATEK